MLLDRMYKYKMDPTRAVGATEQTQNAGWTDGRTEWNQYTPNNFVVQGYNKINKQIQCWKQLQKFA